MKFNFSGLHEVFREAIQKHEPSISFSLVDGRGLFVFILFLKTDTKGNIKWGDLELFILLARTQAMLPLKLYGNHFHRGEFIVGISADHLSKIRRELDLGEANTGHPFDLENFLIKLNGMVPTSLTLRQKIDVIKEHRDAIRIHCKKYVDNASKVYLLRVDRPPNGGKPREETLRKLYMFNEDTQVMTTFIQNLKSVGWTAFWTDRESTTPAFSELFTRVAEQIAARP